MTLDLWLAYLAVAALAIVSPGPAILLALNYGVRFGAGAVLASSLGNIAGLGCLGIAASVGLGAVMSAGGWVSDALHWIGGGYLIWLGIRLWRSPPPTISTDRAEMPGAPRRFLIALVTALTNPKALAFFAAIFPLFIRADAPLPPQFAILTGSFMALSFTSLMICGIGAGRLRRWLSRPVIGRLINRLSGGAMVVFGAALVVRR